MRPDYHQAIIDTIQYYGWQSIIYLYDSHDGELLHIHTKLYYTIPSNSLSFPCKSVPDSQTATHYIPGLFVCPFGCFVFRFHFI